MGSLLGNRHLRQNYHPVGVVAFLVVGMVDVGILVAVDANLVEAVLGHQAACYCQSSADNLRMYTKFK